MDTRWREENSPSNFLVCKIPNRKVQTLRSFIEKYVAPETIVCTDGYPSYPGAVGLLGMRHLVVNHTEGFVNANGDYTNNVENLWSHLKLELRRRNGVMRSNIDPFLSEFSVRKRLIGGYLSEDVCKLWLVLVKLIF